jgi:hypothetical protein
MSAGSWHYEWVVDSRQIPAKLDALARQPFRARFHLNAKEQREAERGEATMRVHAHDLILKRLAPAHPLKDGKQTPYRGHPVFVAQHATATCCRSCLARWHGIGKGEELSERELAYVVDVIWAFIARELARAGQSTV